MLSMKWVIMKNSIMKLKNLGKLKKIASLVFLFGWLGLIFYLSSQKGSISQNSSDSLILFLDKIFTSLNIGVDIRSFEYISFIIRKLAHMFIYFVLYFLVYNVVYQFNQKKCFVLSLFFCFLYAVSDEFHQLFVPNRSCQITDILIDTTASFIAFIILKLISLRKSCKL